MISVELFKKEHLDQIQVQQRQTREEMGEELKNAIKGYIKKKDSDLVGKMVSEGTTPRSPSTSKTPGAGTKLPGSKSLSIYPHKFPFKLMGSPKPNTPGRYFIAKKYPANAPTKTPIRPLRPTNI